MEKDKELTEVMFRKEKSRTFKDTIFALFPHECSTSEGLVTLYQHVGQHSSADYDFCIRKTKPAKKEEYKDLKEEIESLGYNLKIVKKRNYKKFLKSYKEVF